MATDAAMTRGDAGLLAEVQRLRALRATKRERGPARTTEAMQETLEFYGGWWQGRRDTLVDADRVLGDLRGLASDRPALAALYDVLGRFVHERLVAAEAELRKVRDQKEGGK